MTSPIKPHQVLLGGVDIDPGILPLVDAWRKHPFVETYCSCSGHADDPNHTWHGCANITLAVYGMEGIKLLAQILDEMDTRFGYDCGWEASLSYSSEVATSCDFDEYPDWVWFEIESREPLDAQMLEQQAEHVLSFSS